MYKKRERVRVEKITKESLYDLKSVTQPTVWGDLVFFLETKMDKEENTYLTTIYSVHKHTKERIHWGDSGSANVHLEVSPNKKWLSYVSNNTKNKKPQVFLIPLNGGSAEQLTEEENGVSNYQWSSNGATIYYQTSVDKEKEEKKEKEKALPQPTKITKLQYKFDGRGIIPEDKLFQIKKIGVATKEAEVVVEEDRPVGLSYVSKDESYLLVSDKLNPDDEWVYGGSVYKYDIASKESYLLTSDVPKGSFHFEAANDAEDFYLLSGNNFEYAMVTQTKLYGYDAIAHTLTCLTENEDIQIGDRIVGDFQQKKTEFPIEWIDNETYLFSVTEHGKILLYKGNKEGVVEKVYDDRVHLTGGALTEEPSKVAVTYSTLTKPSEVGLLDLSTGEIEQLYNPNEAFVKEHTIVEPDMFWYKGADDWDIQGWYVPPVEKKEKHPAILYIHGGPHVCYGETFFHEMQKLSAEGYGVILLNPRGGNGYGQEFVAAILGDYGNKDYEDLMLGTDYVLEQYPEIDTDNVYVAGGSYGGFMTNWIVGHTDRFKAAVTQRCISNWISFYGTSDVGAFFTEYQLQHDLSDYEELWRMSPLAYAENVKTPLLIIHGEEDLRCPQEQAEQMYIAMKKHGVETKFVLYPKSSHGLSREGLPNLRMERLAEIEKWFATH
jgi:dipeptidyl aminopeptidase/acylaminoacyl peptidase